jgi:hypothetical protein
MFSHSRKASLWEPKLKVLKERMDLMKDRTEVV